MRLPTSIATADEESITVRGKDLTGELVGEYDFGAFFYLLVTGEEPTPAEARLTNAMLVSIAEHGLTPSVVAARLTYAGAPEAVQGAVASGLLGVGDTLVGPTQQVAETVQDAAARIEAGEDPERVATEVVAEHDPLPGFGHPHHEPTDPRTDRLFDLLEAEGLAGIHLETIRAIQAAAEAEYDTRLLINVTGAIGTVASEMGLDPVVARGFGVVARAAGLVAHLDEERSESVAWDLWGLVGEHAEYRGDRPE